MSNLELLLGCPFAELSVADFERLVTERTPEGTQLDFKQEHYKDGQDFAGDVSALANNIGGSLVLGIEEIEGIATTVTPVPLSEEHVLRMQQWLASYTTPRLDAEIRAVPVPSDPQRGLYVIDVPRSVRMPHAVVVKGVSLRYYRRSGPRNHPLSEPEIAEAYYSRFARFRERDARLEQLVIEAAPLKYEDYARTWVAVTLLPAYNGSLDISARTLRAVEQWAARVCEPLNRGQIIRNPRAIPTMDRISVTTRDNENEAPLGYYLQLYTDGAASVAAQLTTFPIFTRSQPGVVTAAGDGLFADSFVRTTAECLRVAVAHASMNAGARGEALARCHLILAGEPVTLGYAQFHDDFNSWKPYYPQRPLHPSATPTPGGKPRGIDTEAILRDPVEWMSATRKVLTDIFHLCGQPEVRQIDESGALNIPYWQTQLLAGWKAVAKVPRVEVNLEPR